MHVSNNSYMWRTHVSLNIWFWWVPNAQQSIHSRTDGFEVVGNYMPDIFFPANLLEGMYRIDQPRYSWCLIVPFTWLDFCAVLGILTPYVWHTFQRNATCWILQPWVPLVHYHRYTRKWRLSPKPQFSIPQLGCSRISLQFFRGFNTYFAFA